MVVYDPADNVQNVLQRAATSDTCLTGWFKANADPSLILVGAHNYLYQDFPKGFVWNQQQKKWTAHQRGNVIRRMFAASPSSGERFYLRLLLTVVKGKYLNAHVGS